MSDKNALLGDYPEAGYYTPNITDKIRSRLAGFTNAFTLRKVATGNANKDENDRKKKRCCKHEVNIHSSPKYSVAFIAATWGFLANVERSIILPTMFLYFTTTWDTETANNFYGSTLSAFSFSILIATPIFGYAGHANMNVKNLLLSANFLGIIGNLVYLAAYRPCLVLLGRLIAGIGASCESPMYADLTRTTAVKERTSFIILLLLTRQVGLLFGPAFTIVLSYMKFNIGSFSINVYNGVGLVLACLWTIHSLFIVIYYPILDKSGSLTCNQKCSEFTTSSEASTEAKYTHSDGVSSKNDRIITNQRHSNFFPGYFQLHIIAIYATIFASYFSVMALEASLSPVANRFFNWNELEVSYIYIGASILIIVVSIIMHLMSKYIEDRRLILFGLVILFLAYVYLAVVVYNVSNISPKIGKILVIFGISLHVVGAPFTLAISESLYTKCIPPQHMDKAQTILRTVINVSYLAGPFVGGTFHGNPTLVFTAMLFTTLIPLLMFLMKFQSFKISTEPNSLKGEQHDKVTKPVEYNFLEC